MIRVILTTNKNSVWEVLDFFGSEHVTSSMVETILRSMQFYMDPDTGVKMVQAEFIDSSNNASYFCIREILFLGDVYRVFIRSHECSSLGRLYDECYARHYNLGGVK